MNSEQRYRNTLRGMTPSPAWRESTLAAMKEAYGQKERLRRRPMLFAAAAAALALAVTGGIWWSGRMTTDPNDPGVARTPEPAITPTLSPASSALPADPIWNDTFSIVTDSSQVTGNNPTAGRLDELTELPVYENPISTEEQQRTLLNHWAEVLGLTLTETDWYPAQGEHTMSREPSLYADCADGCWIWLDGSSQITIYESPNQTQLKEAALAHLGEAGLEAVRENTESYFYTADRDATQATWWIDPGAPLAEQLYAYSFRRVEDTYGAKLTISLPPTATGVNYPLRAASDAVASFRSGDYWGSNYTIHPDQAEILQITLEYDTGPGQPYFQPVYRILFTQDYWDEVIPSLLQNDGLDASVFTGVGIAYVPAIDPEYQDEVPYRRYFNDGLAHHTPEDLP